MNVTPTEDIRTRTRWRGLVLLAGVVGLFVLLNVAAVTVVAVAPERCLECHTPSGETALEVREGHAGAACLDCHGGDTVIGKVGFASRQVYGMYLEIDALTEGRSASAVHNVSCVACHDVTKAVAGDGAIRIDHASCATGRKCTDCHSRVAHGDSVAWPRSYDMFDCVPCHMSQAQSVQCDFCHTARSQQERVATGTFALTHGANWRETHGMGDSLTCGACHSSEKCVKCHGAGVPHLAAFSRNHSEPAMDPGAQCRTCHQPRFCDDCHGIEMPHPQGFTPAHSRIAEAEGEEACQRCHAPSDCVECHVKHVHPGGAKQGSGG